MPCSWRRGEKTGDGKKPRKLLDRESDKRKERGRRGEDVRMMRGEGKRKKLRKLLDRESDKRKERGRRGEDERMRRGGDRRKKPD